MTIGSRIAFLRKKKQLTQQALANKLFVTDKTISSWEQDRTEPSLEQISSIAEILECSIPYLLYGKSSKNDIEMELKIKLSEDEYHYFEQTLKTKAKFLNSSNHKDTYYKPTYRSFVNDSSQERLRIGIRGNKTIVTYKRRHEVHSDEYEVEIDDFENLNKIFLALNLEKIATIEKIRKTYLYLDKYEIGLDNVKDLGYFIEIEIKKYDSDIDKEYEELIKVAKELNINVNNIVRKGYLSHFVDE